MSASEPKLDHKSIASLFVHRAKETPNREAYRYPNNGDWESITWYEAFERVRAIASGLRALGLQDEQRVGLLCSTRYEWILTDLGILCAGGATTTVYPSNTAEECAYILGDSEAVMIFAEDDGQIAKLREQRANLPRISKVITIDGTADGDWVISLADLEKRGNEAHEANPDQFDQIVASVDSQQLATLIYTSGTTGKPKGVRLVHECWTYEAAAMEALGIMHLDDLQYLWLPLSHSFGKVMQVGQLQIGFATAVDGRIDKLVDNLAVVKPTFMAAAPRIFEKVYNKVVTGAKEKGGLTYGIFTWAVKVGSQVSQLRQHGKEPGRGQNLLRANLQLEVFERDQPCGAKRVHASGSTIRPRSM